MTKWYGLRTGTVRSLPLLFKAYRIFGTLKKSDMKQQVLMNRKYLEALTGYVFVLPDLLGLSLFLIIPAFFGLYLGLHEWTGIGTMRYVGLANFKKIFKDVLFVNSLFTTFKLVVFFVPLNFLFGLGLALLVQRRTKIVGLFRTIYFAPVAISAVSIGLIWKFMCQPKGVVNALLTAAGMAPQPLLGSTSQALFVLLTTMLYQSAGYYMVIFIAGLNDIPQELYEAASIDGATWFQRLRFVTLPLLKPVSLFVLVMSLLSGFQVFDQIQILTGGGPFYATTTAVFYAYRMAFQFYQFGYASAINFIVFLVQLLISLMIFKTMREGRI
ncbi:MAG: sugar ABC transporter permease [Candidatus Hadarchaeum sp.]|uniref:carbohydrate ABC transporter permease n=1 Tax=Candidatus Hadarchaeum sp. TaxID=2883567 RepID=UPI003175E5B0